MMITLYKDIKGANLLVDAYGVVKLADFGMAKHQSMHIHYTTPPPQFQLGSIPMNLRGNWEIARRDLNNPRFIAMVSTDRNFLGTTYDEYADSTSRSLMCCRSVAAFLFSYKLQGLLCQSTLYSEQ